MVLTDEDKGAASKNYLERLLNTEFTWDRNSFSKGDTACEPHCFIDKGKVRKSFSQINNGKAVGTSGSVSEMLKSLVETRIPIFLIEFPLWKAEQWLRGMELQEKEEENDEKDVQKLFRKNSEKKCVN